jgi:cytochrome o ubiquinol oxidase subunit 1
MGMPRRLERYYNPEWQPYLIVAAAGAVLILCGILCLVMQLYVSIRDRAALRDDTGDPWDGRTLEWATASPPAPYNFAVTPTVTETDALWAMKQAGTDRERPTRYDDILMPDSTGAGVVLGVLAFVFAFAMVWYIWWLAIATGLAMGAVIAFRTFDDKTEHVIPAAEVEAIERQRGMASAGTGGAA